MVASILEGGVVEGEGGGGGVYVVFNASSLARSTALTVASVSRLAMFWGTTVEIGLTIMDLANLRILL